VGGGCSAGRQRGAERGLGTRTQESVREHGGLAVGNERTRTVDHGADRNSICREREGKGIRWGLPQNCRLNGKTERKQRDERGGVLTFGQRSTMATEGLVGVGEESPESGKTTEPTSDSRDRVHHGVELDDGNSRVVPICTDSARFHRKSSLESSPEFSRCKSSATVYGS
jgi:hypothetical protein